MHYSKLIIYNDRLTTAILKSDIRKSSNLLTPLVLYTDAFEWGVRNFSHRKWREVWLDLLNH